MANSYRNAAVVLSSTGATDLYTAPANTRAIVQSVNVANVDGSDRYVTVTWYDSSAAASYTLLYNGFVPAGTALNALDTPIVLEQGDIIRVQASAANAIHATASILQIDPSSSLPDSAITTSKISDGAVTSTKLASSVSVTTICTSTTRPTAPVEGQEIYETDTNLSFVWSGTSWVSPPIAHRVPSCRVRKTATQSYTNPTTISWDTDSGTGAHDTGSMWSAGNPTVITIPETGLYFVSCSVWAGSATGGAITAMQLFLNTNASGGFADYGAGFNSGTAAAASACGVTSMTAGDTLSVQLYFNGSGTGLTVAVGSSMSAAWIGAA